MTYGYIRVSTEKQTVENQRFEILRFAQRQGPHRGRLDRGDHLRHQELRQAQAGRAPGRRPGGDLILCAELSRLGRSLFMIMEILHLCMRRGRRVWTIKDGYRLGMTSRPRSWPSPLASPRRLSATSSPSAPERPWPERRPRGSIWAVPRGALSKKVKLTGKEDAIRVLRAEGTSWAQIARLLHVDRSTLVRFAKSRMLEA